MIQPYVPTYREPLFRELRSRLTAHGAELIIAVDRERVDRKDHTSSQVDVVLGSRLEGNARWRPVRQLRLGVEDLVVAEQALKHVEVYPLLARPRYRRPGFAFWGHGRFASQSAALDRVKQAVTRRADWFFAYTQAGADWVGEHGFPASRVTVLRNTIDGEALARDLVGVNDRDVAEYRSIHGLSEGATALFLGGVDADKDVGFLLAAADSAADMIPGFTMLFAGDGTGLQSVMEAERRGCHVRVLGHVEGRSKALALRSSSVLVVPRGVGLVAVDAIISGLPVVALSRAGHGPEFAYLEGKSVVRVTTHARPVDIAEAMSASMKAHEQQHFDIEACLTRGREWGIEAMASRFMVGLESWNEIRHFRL